MKLAPPKYLETLFIYALFTLTSTCLHIKKNLYKYLKAHTIIYS